jgi:hypothetical protein
MNTMSASQVSDVEIFVYKNDDVVFFCPKCKLKKKIQVDDIKNVNHWNIGATCQRCDHKFCVSFNFRKFYRKEVSISGYISYPSERDEILDRILVTDISLMGIGFEVKKYMPQAGEDLVVRFMLDDESNFEFERHVSVKSVRASKIGASFTGVQGFDAVLSNFILGKKN